MNKDRILKKKILNLGINRFLLIFFLLISIHSKAQALDKDTITLLAKLVDVTQGKENMHARYKKIKVISGVIKADTIMVVYGYFTFFETLPDTAFLTLTPLISNGRITNWYNCPNRVGEFGIEEAKIYTIPFNYWENCEKGIGACLPFMINRNVNTSKCFLILPCGGTATSIYFNSAKDTMLNQSLSITQKECPPYFNLSETPDGIYNLNMLSCGLGGSISVQLNTLPRLKGTYQNYWARTDFNYSFHENNTFTFKMRGHAGDDTSAGVYYINGDSLFLSFIDNDSSSKTFSKEYRYKHLIITGDFEIYESIENNKYHYYRKIITSVDDEKKQTIHFKQHVTRGNK